MKEIAAALVKAQKAFGPALKTSTNPAFRSKYAKLENCIDAVIDALNDNGIMLMQPTHLCEDGVIIETMFLHESGEQLSAGKLHVPAWWHPLRCWPSLRTHLVAQSKPSVAMGLPCLRSWLAGVMLWLVPLAALRAWLVPPWAWMQPPRHRLLRQ